jgi:flagellar biosynthetic protein FliQ
LDIGVALDMGRDALLMALTAAAPVLVMGMAVGLIIALAQAVTQLQEQTVQFVPKIVAMVVAAMLFVPWIASRLLEYARVLFGQPPF